MARTSKHAKSLLDLQKTLTDLATWKVAAARARQTELETTQQDLLTALGAWDGIGSALAPFVSKKLTKVGRDLTTARENVEEQSRQALAHGARSKTAERIHQRAELAERAQAERKALIELIENQVSRKSSSA